MKSKSFSEMIALQQGIPLASLKYVDFRVKDRNALASRYDIQVHFTSENGVLASTRPIKSTKLHGMDWGLGYFKAPACDWCDDIAGETADFACGDAWLPEYVGDPLGTSVMIARNPTIEAILQAGRDDGSVALEAIGVSKIYESQAGNYRHRQEGLSVRIRDAQKKGIWFPNKRIKSNSFHVGIRRKVIYRFRKTLMNQSHISFNNAKSKRSYFIFMIKMLPLEVIYSILNQNFIKNSVKLSVIFCRYFRNRLSR